MCWHYSVTLVSKNDRPSTPHAQTRNNYSKARHSTAQHTNTTQKPTQHTVTQATTPPTTTVSINKQERQHKNKEKLSSQSVMIAVCVFTLVCFVHFLVVFLFPLSSCSLFSSFWSRLACASASVWVPCSSSPPLLMSAKVLMWHKAQHMPVLSDGHQLNC